MPTLTGKTVLILGGWGLVGQAICQELLTYNPKKLVVCSLHENEAKDGCKRLEEYKEAIAEDLSIASSTELVPEWGDIFAREEHKNIKTRNPKAKDYLEKVIQDTFEDLGKIDVAKNFLYCLLINHKPDIVIDSVNTATGVAYQDIYKSVIELRKSAVELEDALDQGEQALAKAAKTMVQRTREHLAGIYLPRLIRHVQVLYKGMEASNTGHYIKIGTTGTGGMGLNIPYTHSEEKPSQKLLSKSAVGGAHSLLLYLMSKTPDMANTMEFKPAAAIAWKKITYDKVKRAGNPIKLYDNSPEKAFELGNSVSLSISEDDRIAESGNELKAVFIDTGENGVFSAGEFSAITTTGQMEFITPQEISAMVIEELKGGNSGHDIMGSLSNSVMRSTYRAGFMRDHAIRKMRELEKKNNDDSVAFEILGPPRLSKLLYEAYLIKRIYKTPEAVLNVDPERMSEDFQRLVTVDTDLRRRIISIGIPILMPDGKRLVRGPNIVIPPYRGNNEVEINEQNIKAWTHDGWVDLRPKNMEHWQGRMKLMAKLIARHDWETPGSDTSSSYNRKHFMVNGELNIGEIVGWIFNNEEKGARKFYTASAVQIEP